MRNFKLTPAFLQLVTQTYTGTVLTLSFGQPYHTPRVTDDYLGVRRPGPIKSGQ